MICIRSYLYYLWVARCAIYYSFDAPHTGCALRVGYTRRGTWVPTASLFRRYYCDAAPSILSERGRSAPTMDHTRQRIAHERARQPD
jgi:hypothetical protein